ncbi:unnamed protein product [Arctia plantaginis]|uniref:Uncharacterized protein n=1 Tax=Arctia plantaginis TaxID=874455 RepID=A0A8S0Z478_ARCPL|nr:unnamed protein product [Arctia plantaginis]
MDNILIVPDNILIVPDNILIVPDNILIVPDNILIVPDNILIVPVLETVQRNPRLGTRTTAKFPQRHRTSIAHWTLHKILRRARLGMKVPIARLPRICFQHDSAPPHVVRYHLNEMFPQRWIGRFD